jgi:selenide,water dikinase
VGSEGNDDAGVYRLRADLAVVNTVDFFPPLVDDAYVFGQIAAANAMSDVFAMGGRPVTALNIVAYPPDHVSRAAIGEILRGGAERVAEAGAVVVGGHTVIDAELKYGMAITGVIHPDRVVRNRRARSGDVLVLTKPLGTGIVTTGMKSSVSDVAEERAAIASMVALNDVAGSNLHRFDARACTDVTGYGLAGHAAEMALASTDVRMAFDADAITLLPGTARLAESGYVTGGSRRNRAYLGRRLSVGRDVCPGVAEAVIDPQTSGGLLVSLPAREAAGYVAALHGRGLRPVIVGRVEAKTARSVALVTVS